MNSFSLESLSPLFQNEVYWFLAKTTLWMASTLLVYTLLRNKTAALRHSFLLGSFVGMLFLPLFQYSLPEVSLKNSSK